MTPQLDHPASLVLPIPRALVPTLVFLGMVVAVVSSLGAPLIPAIAAKYGVTLGDAQWSLTITLLVGALATPTMGRLGDGPRRRLVILGALGAVVVGSALAALPLGFGALIAGRGLQGIGIGLTPLAMATARSALPHDRSRSAVALLSITTVAGVGLGYPITGLIAQSLGLHAGFWFGAIVSSAALVAAIVVLPASPARDGSRLDFVSALLLGAALASLLLAITQGERWGWASWRLIGLALAAVLLFIAWGHHELRTPHPLVDLRLVRDRSVLTADVTALLAGVGMYLLLATVVRYVQTPPSAGYGFGASIVVAGLVLLPFSAASVAASRVGPYIARRTSAELVLPIGCVTFFVAMLSFAEARGALWQVFVTMAIAGLGVSCTFAAMPALIVRAVPVHETGSAMSFNLVLRYIGYSTGSALSAALLDTHTPAGRTLPLESGYDAIAWTGCGLWVLSAAVSFVLPRTRTVAPVDEVLAEESIADAIPSDEDAEVVADPGTASLPGRR
jgi:predicted MFS family arabinose efflux permease